jgi:SAM-dependent methyltransferase
LNTRPEDVRVLEAFEAPTALENRFIVELMKRHFGDLGGVTLLDLGCGLGESSTYFACHGAEVTATDLSAEMLGITRDVAALHEVSLKTVATSADLLPFKSKSFDAVYIANTLHHLPARDKALGEVHRVLRPGGFFYSWDPLAYNPVINVYRRMADRVRTDDENPLDFEILELARRWFPDLGFRCFWLSTLVLFLKYYIVDGVHPNEDRYWKRILGETNRTLRWWRPFLWLDRLLTRLPGIRAWSWNVVLWGRKPPDTLGQRIPKT